MSFAKKVDKILEGTETRYGYHATEYEYKSRIARKGLLPQESPDGPELFFAGNEDDIAPYNRGGLVLRFPFPPNAIRRIGRGDYYTTDQTIPPDQIEWKTDTWEDWKPLVKRKRATPPSPPQVAPLPPASPNEQ